MYMYNMHDYLCIYVRMYILFSGSLEALYLSSPSLLHPRELFSSSSYTDRFFQLAQQPPVLF